MVRHMPYSDPDRQREYQAQWRAKRRAAWFEGRRCLDCGSREDLTLDHVDPKTKVSHKIWSWSRARREAELAKCVVRCLPCHRKKTARYREYNNKRTICSFEIAEEIRARYAAGGVLQRELAEEYKLSRGLVGDILCGRRWHAVLDN